MISFQTKELTSQKSVKLVKNNDSKYENYLKKIAESKMNEGEIKTRKKYRTMDPTQL